MGTTGLLDIRAQSADGVHGGPFDRVPGVLEVRVIDCLWIDSDVVSAIM